MRASQFHIQTQKNVPNEAEVASHRMMLRTGMIHKVAGGIYTYLPLGLRVIKKIERIVREEMNAAGALELLMPVVQPAELWMESGRWTQYGSELLRLKDRHQRDFVLQATSEELITDLARNSIHSWRQLPVNFYHIQTKFRDERRPRFGLMRGREFIMKDAYSFDRNEQDAHASYQRMYAAYTRIFQRLGLVFRAVQADTGAIGGSLSHEFQVIADTGEDVIVYNPQTDYAANIEMAAAPCLIAQRTPAGASMAKVATPDTTTCAALAQLLGIALEKTVKAIVMTQAVSAGENEPAQTPPQICLLLVRGDHELNEIKVSKLPGLDSMLRLATEAEIQAAFGCPPGYLGPVFGARGINANIRVIADQTVAHMSDFVCGANEAGFHLTGVNWGRDLPEPEIHDIRNVVDGDPDPNAENAGQLVIQRGIEVGHIFFLGDKYSRALNATYLETDGKPAVLQMGCYGIGISRIAAAAIEQNHDEQGIIWPRSLAPFEVVICPVGAAKSGQVRETAEQLYAQLQALGVEVILDDRDLRPGVMFADWELIGVPLRVTIGERGLKNGVVELGNRKDQQSREIPAPQVAEQIMAALAELA